MQIYQTVFLSWQEMQLKSNNTRQCFTEREMAGWPEHSRHITCCQRSSDHKIQADVNTFTFHFLNIADLAKFRFTYWATFHAGGEGLRKGGEKC